MTQKTLSSVATALKLDNVTFHRGEWHLEASCTVSTEDFVVIFGPSGGGKSTLLEAIIGLHPYEGNIYAFDENIDTLAPAKRPFSLLFQSYNLFAHLNLEQNALLGISPRAKPTPENLARITDIFKNLEINHLRTRLPSQISGGQCQRAALARALLQQKKILLLDEPFAALGPGQRQRLLAMLRQIQEEYGLTIMLVTHQAEDFLYTSFLSDITGLFLQDGKILAQAPLEFLLGPEAPSSIKYYLGTDSQS